MMMTTTTTATATVTEMATLAGNVEILDVVKSWF